MMEKDVRRADCANSSGQQVPEFASEVAKLLSHLKF